MNQKIKRIFTDSRVIILLIVVLIAYFAINPQPFNSGVTIRNVAYNSSAYLAGIESPKPSAAPTSKERIVEINAQPIQNLEDYFRVMKGIAPNRTIHIRTNKGEYQVVSGNTPEALGLSVYDAPKTNIRLGLDLQGGTRVLLKPEEKLDPNQLEVLIANLIERLNVYGLSDIVVRGATDLSGNQFILVEIAGANEEEVQQLIARQGKFEAKIGNQTVFKGGNDITYVCRTADCSGIDSRRGCGAAEDGYVCRFMFSISLSPEAAERQAAITSKLGVISQNDGQYLNETLDLFLDDVFVDKLNIAADLKGRAVTDIAISGSGLGQSQNNAIENTLSNMKRLQTILITGSLPVKLEIMRTDTISPSLGQEFTRNAMFVSMVAILMVALVVLIRYRNWLIIGPILIITWLEIFFIIAFAALIGWNLDVASIAGIIISIGTGVDDQIIISDETLKGAVEDKAYSFKKKIQKAFFIVFSSYLTSLGSMTPLIFAGAGMLRGFAITTLIGLTIGVFITRPAFANIIEILVKE
ncbi:MAG: hypothetical protein ABIG95_01770 [Candidatus Woesearchaeota archaeon]